MCRGAQQASTVEEGGAWTWKCGYQPIAGSQSTKKGWRAMGGALTVSVSI